MPFNILLVDGHQIMRDGLKAILRENEDFKVIAETENGREAIQICKSQSPDIVVMAIGLPDLNGIETMIEMLRQSPAIRVLILSMYDDDHSVISAIRGGARGFVCKKASVNEVLQALRTVTNGGFYLGPEISQHLLRHIHDGDMETRPASTAIDLLTQREAQILRAVADGNSSKEIAALLELSELTVRGYRKTLMKKLGVNNIAGLTQIAVTAGIASSRVAAGSFPRPRTFDADSHDDREFSLTAEPVTA